MTHRNSTSSRRLRSATASFALVAGGVFVGVTSQQSASADISSGDRPVLISIEPCRLSDTRQGDNQVGPRAVPLGASDVHTVDAQEADTPCTGKIPADATALSLNVTALNATELSFLTIWAGGDRPLAASLNPAPGQPPVPNAVITQLSVDQEFEVYNNAGTVNTVIDVNGYYTNHNHDDRYYTEAESDDRYATPGEVQEMIDKALDGERARSAGRVLASGFVGNNNGTNVSVNANLPDGFTVTAERTSVGDVTLELTGPMESSPQILVNAVLGINRVACRLGGGNFDPGSGAMQVARLDVECADTDGPDDNTFAFIIVSSQP